MTQRYERTGISFLYPENWTISDEQFDSVPQSVTIQSTSSAFWSVHVYPSSFYPTGVFLGLACFIFCVVFSELFRAVTARARVRKESLTTAFTNTILRNNRRWGGYTVNLEIAILTGVEFR